MRGTAMKSRGRHKPQSPEAAELILTLATELYADDVATYLDNIRVADRTGVGRTRIAEITNLHNATVKKICDDPDYTPGWGHGQ